MGYFIVGCICFVTGVFAGLFMMGICAAAYDDCRQDPCDGCFGAANNDCRQCKYWKGR